MSSFHHNKLYWRITLLLLCGIALIGPWWFETTARMGRDCSSGFAVDREFCAHPVSGLFLVLFAFGSVYYLLSGPFALSMGLAAWFAGLLHGLLFLLPLLPFPVTFVVMMLQEDDNRRGQLVQVVVWSTAVIGAGFISLLSFTSGPRWALWGLWLYICLALAILLLESLELFRGYQFVSE